MMEINNRLRRLASLTLAMFGLSSAAVAATGTSAEFKMDLRGLRPWKTHPASTSETIAYSTAWATNLTAAQQASANAVVKVYPAKRNKPKYIAIDLSGGTAATHYPIECLEDVPNGGWTDEYKTTKLVLRHIPAGSFIMGSRATDYPGAVNTNLHMVTLTKDFYMGVFEVTQRQWELVIGNRPSYFTNEICYATRPVECVSYQDIRGGDKGLLWPQSKEVDDESFMGIIRCKAGITSLDLPTEAQWEYACRAGTTTAFNNGMNITGNINEDDCAEIENVARYCGNSNFENMTWDERKACSDEYCSAKVGSYRANYWGLYDMHGNLWEWCADAIPTAPDHFMIRGGSYKVRASRCTAGFCYSDTEQVGYP